jgi:hypothetical protein
MSGPTRKGTDSFVDQLGDRLSSEPSAPQGALFGAGPAFSAGPPLGAYSSSPPPLTAPIDARRALPGISAPAPARPEDFDEALPTVAEQPVHSDVHALPELAPLAATAGDPFAEFEDDVEGEATRIDTSHLIAEESTTILKEGPEPPHLVVVSGKDEGKRFALSGEETSVGRSIDNDVILTDIAVSRKHMKVVVQNGHPMLKDLGSGNGSLLNGEKVRDAILKHGDRIEIGETVLMYEAPQGGGPVGAPAPFPSQRPYPPGPPAYSGPPARPGAVTESIASPSFGMNTTLPPGAVGVHTDYHPAPGQPGARPTIPRPYLFGFLGIGAMIVVLLAAIVTALVLGGGDDEESTVAAVSEDVTTEFNEGMRAYSDKDFARAKRSFERVLELRPTDVDARDALTRTEAAIVDQGHLEEARRAIAAQDWARALQESGRVGSASPLSPDAGQVREHAQREWLRTLSEGVDRDLAQGNADSARLRLAAAREFAPTDPRVLAMESAIARAAQGGREVVAELRTPVEEPAPQERRPEPTNATPMETRSPTPMEIREVTAMDVRPVATMEVRQTMESRPVMQVEPTMRTRVETPRETTMRLPTPIAGGEVDSLIAEARRLRTSSTLGCRKAQEAGRVSPGHPEVRQLLAECTRNAESLLTRAASSQPSSARAMYLQVLQMVPPSSPLHERARNGLRNVAQDEDE